MHLFYLRAPCSILHFAFRPLQMVVLSCVVGGGVIMQHINLSSGAIDHGMDLPSVTNTQLCDFCPCDFVVLLEDGTVYTTHFDMQRGIRLSLLKT